MTLFDIYYTDQTFDSSIPLPQPTNAYKKAILRGAVARCVNGEQKTLKFSRGVWVEVIS